MKIPDGLEDWTADEVAECLSVGDELYIRLWQILNKASTHTPLGGDGSNGTCEYPDARYNTTEGDKALQWWDLLTNQEQQTITNAYAKAQ